MKDIDEMTDTIELLKKGIKKQLESAISYIAIDTST